jgi:hypothetical protein
VYEDDSIKFTRHQLEKAAGGDHKMGPIQNGSGAHPDSYPMGTRDPFPGGRRPGREADNSPPSSAEVKE